jgi:hypothetical protein
MCLHDTRTCKAGYASDRECMLRHVFGPRLWRVGVIQTRREEWVGHTMGLLVVHMRVWRSDRIEPFDKPFMPRFVVIDRGEWCWLILRVHPNPNLPRREPCPVTSGSALIKYRDQEHMQASFNKVQACGSTARLIVSLLA